MENNENVTNQTQATQTPTPMEVTPQVQPTAQNVVQNDVQQFSDPTLPPQGAVPQAQPPKKNNLAFIIIVAVLVVVILVLGVLVVVKNLGGKSDKGGNKTTTTAVTQEETFTTVNTTRSTAVNSTTKYTYTTNPTYNYTTMPTTTKVPEPVIQTTNVYSVDGYKFELDSNMSLYQLNSGITVVKDDGHQTVFGISVINNYKIEDLTEADIKNLGTEITSAGYVITDAAAGTYNGIDMFYVTYTDGAAYFCEIYMDSPYGDIINYSVFAATPISGDSLSEDYYSFTMKGVKVSANKIAKSGIGKGTVDKAKKQFDSRLLK